MRIIKYMLMAILLLATGDAFAQTILSGKVTEDFAGKQEPITGANVNIVNSQNRSLGGTITDLNGAYNLKIPANEKDLTIVYSFIGMKTKKVKYTGQKSLNIQLDANVETLEEVSVVARKIERNSMGISQKEQVSATQRVKMDDLVATSPVFSVEEALQGQLGGVDIITGGGDPGAKSTIHIRGTSSLNASSEPLIVIDGVPYTTSIDDDFDFSTANNEDLGALLNIAPTDIESIEVLKDAAATAIWGTKGANGVLMITTKRGSTGKTNFSFSSKFTAKIEPESIPMLNGNEYTALMQEAIWNSANYRGVNNASDLLSLLFNTPEIGYNPEWQYFNEYNQNTDWLKEIRQTGLTWDNNFSMNGGGEKASYRFSLGYLSDGGTTIGTHMNRLNTSLAIDYQFSKKLKFGADFSYSETNTDANWANVRGEAFGKMPNKSPYWIDPATGERTSQYFSRQTGFESVFSGNDSDNSKSENYNPVAMALEGVNKTIQREEKITFRADYELLPGLSYKGWASMNMRSAKTRKFLPQVATGVVWTDKYANQSTDALSDKLSLQTENKLIYTKSWNKKHNLIANALVRTAQTQQSSYTSITSGNASSGLSDPIIGSSVEKIGSGESEVRSISGIALANYTLLDRYIVQGSINAEGNSAMGKSKRMGYFPAAGISWNVQNEPFLKKQDWLNEFKLRFSVGQSGNAPSGASIYLGAFSSLGEYMGMKAIQPVRMQLDNLKWETATEYNYGIDLGFFRHRLRFTIDYYQKYVKDLLQKDVEVPASTGYAKIKYFNSGELTNKGWEFRTDALIIDKKDFKLSGYINLSRNINEVSKLPENLKQENYSFANGKYAVRIEAGRPIGSFYGYRYNGVYQNKEATYARDKEGNIMNDVKGSPIVMKNGGKTVYPGDAIYEDINHDGVINEYDIVYLGNSNPILTGGAGLSLKWKQLTASVSFHGRFGQKLVNTARMNNEAMYGKSNQSRSVLKRWRNEGDDTDVPRALFNEGYNYLGSDRFVENSSYLRLKSISLSYNLPKTLIRKWGFNSMSVFVTGYDLYTWTNYTGQDPEVAPPGKATDYAQDKATTPCSIRFAGGINMNF